MGAVSVKNKFFTQLFVPFLQKKLAEILLRKIGTNSRKE
jgi:hypothetical protein